MKPKDVESGLTVDLLRSAISYDKNTGKFFHKITTNQNTRNGAECGWLNPITGYIIITVFGRKYMAHRLAWLHVHGEWPKDRIDHKNGIRSDNRFENLRGASNSQNGGNMKVRKDNILGCKGVRLHECGKYVARIGIKGEKHSTYLGLFETKEQAMAAYLDAAKRQFGKFARAS
jgi:hypothetical protein